MSPFKWQEFAAALDTVRESRGQSWKDISDQSGVAMKTLNRVARGLPCDIDTLAALRQWLGVGIDRFFANGSAKVRET